MSVPALRTVMDKAHPQVYIRQIEMAKPRRKARCVVIAGPNGAGKTTFARRYLPEHGVIHFVNADLIASGLSPLRPDLAAIAAARMLLREFDKLAVERSDFAFETTLSGLSYIRRLQTRKQNGYCIEIVYCPDVRDADLCVEKRQSCGAEAVTP